MSTVTVRIMVILGEYSVDGINYESGGDIVTVRIMVSLKEN